MRSLFLALALLVILKHSLAQTKEAPYVLLISFDGFRSDYVELFNLPNFKKFIAEGAAADAMLPSFPSKTFPNHYTIVTGMYPGHHGLVDNTFYDPELQTTYGMRDRKAVVNKVFYGGKPLWQLARDNNIPSASYFWVGSELQEEGLHPDFFLQYDQSVEFDERVEQIIDWLKLPEENRPHMITLYFHSPDYESHRHGPLAEETKQKVLQIDSLLGQIMNKIDSTHLPVNMILVSDHGMSELKEEESTYIFIDELIKSTSTIQVANGGTQAHIHTSSPQQTDSLYRILAGKSNGFKVVKRKDFPSRWHYDHPRSGDILLMAEPGKYIVSGAREKSREGWQSGKTFGAHGYDPDVVQDMAGIFYAKGPNIRKGVKVAKFRNIHVYPLIAEILGIKPPKVDGELSVLKSILNK